MTEVFFAYIVTWFLRKSAFMDILTIFIKLSEKSIAIEIT